MEYSFIRWKQLREAQVMSDIERTAAQNTTPYITYRTKNASKPAEVPPQQPKKEYPEEDYAFWAKYGYNRDQAYAIMNAVDNDDFRDIPGVPDLPGYHYAKEPNLKRFEEVLRKQVLNSDARRQIMYTVMNDTIAQHAFKQLMQSGVINDKTVRDFVQTLLDVGLYAHAGGGNEPPIKMRRSGIIGAVKNAYHNWQDRRKEAETRSLMGRFNTPPPDPNLPKTIIQ